MEGRRGEVEACWPAGPGRLGVGEAGEEQKEGRAEAEEARKRGKEGGACRCERGREEQRTRELADGGRRLGAPPSSEAQRRCSCLLAAGGSTGASGRLRSSSATLTHTHRGVILKVKLFKKDHQVHRFIKIHSFISSILHQPGVLPAKSLCPVGLRVGKPPAKSPPKEGPMGAVPPDEP